MRGRLLIFSGIPGCGKTTIAKLVGGAAGNAILIQTDNVRMMLAHPSYSSAESRFVYDACFGIAKEALKNGYLVMLDGTFMREEYRSEAKNELKRYYSRADVVWVYCPLETALRRNSRRKAVVPPEKVEGMFRGFEAPRRAVKIDTSRLSPKAAAQRILRELSLRRR